MTDKFFIDTNILVYACIGNDQVKHGKTLDFFKTVENKEIFVSTQILSELYSALSKNGIDEKLIKNYLINIANRTIIAVITLNTIKYCLDLKEKYRYSYWDSLVLATALENNCSIVFSEDMKHNQLIEIKMRIVNPFVYN
jgi:predicted nucleic acid-binding protein